MTDLSTPASAEAVPGSWGRRWRNFDRSKLLWLLVIAVLLALVVNPLARLFTVSFTDDQSGALTLLNYVKAYSLLRYLAALGNSVVLGLSVAVLGTIFGVPMAWAISRTDMPCKGLVWVSILGTFIVPSYLGAVGWILLAGPSGGWVNRTWMQLTGMDHGIVNIYSMPGLVLVVASYSFPYMFVFTKSALDLISSEMEDAANILGAGILRTTLKVTLPLALPAILGAVIIMFLEAIALFGVPALLALPGRFQTVTTMLWQFFQYPPHVGVAAAYAMPLLAITILLFALQRRIIARKGYVALTGKGGARRMVRLGKARWAMLGYCLAVCSLSVYMPMAVLLQAAFSTAWGRGMSWANLTLANLRAVLTDHITWDAIWNTFAFAGAASAIAILLALLIAYVVHRRLVPMGNCLSFIAMAPFVIPGMVLAIGFYACYTNPPLVLYGTAWILILAFATRFLPIAYSHSLAAMRSINPELEDAARILGGTRVTAVRRVVAPLLKKGLAGGFILVFIPATRELSSAIFLYSINTRVLSVLLFDKSDEGNFEMLASIGLVLVVITVALVLIAFRIVGRDYLLERSPR